MRDYFGPLAKEPIPAWEASRQRENWNTRKDMLLELDAQVSFCHSNITKVKDRSVAVNHVLDQWHIKMETFEYVTEGQKQRPRNKLTVAQVAGCFWQARDQKKEPVKLKPGTKADTEFCCAEEFLRAFGCKAGI